jgi:hypothetical protein
MAAGGLTFHFLPSEFAPVADVGRTVVFMEAPEGASFEYTQQNARKVEAIVEAERAQYGDIDRALVRMPGNFEGGGDVNSARIFLVLKDWHERTRSAQEISQSIAQKASGIPGVRINTFSPGGLGRGFGKPIQAALGGPDYEQLAQWSNQLMLLAQRNPGLTNVDTNYKERKPQIRVSVDRDRAADLGVSLETVGRTLESMLGSRIVTTYVDRGREYNVILQSRADERATTTDLTNIQVRSDRTGQLIPLSNLVTLQETAGAVSLNRFNRIRTIEISTGLAPGYTMGEAVKWFQDTVRDKLPAGASLAFNGESGEFLKSGGQLYTTFIFAIAIVFLVLAAQFESFIHPAIIMMAARCSARCSACSMGSASTFSARSRGHARASRPRTVSSSLRTSFVIKSSSRMGESGRHAPAPHPHDQPLHGVRRAALPVRHGSGVGAAQAYRRGRVLWHAGVGVPHAVRGARRVFAGCSQDEVTSLHERSGGPPHGCQWCEGGHAGSSRPGTRARQWLHAWRGGQVRGWSNGRIAASSRRQAGAPQFPHRHSAAHHRVLHRAAGRVGALAARGVRHIRAPRHLV